MNINFKPGDLIEWTDHRIGHGTRFVGIYLRLNDESPYATWADIVDLCNGEELKWVSWQCAVVNAS